MLVQKTGDGLQDAANRRNCAAAGLALEGRPLHTASMFSSANIALLLLAALFVPAAMLPKGAPVESAVAYTSDGQLKLPEDYRSWVYLTSGFDMSYNPALQAQMNDHHMFDNVFVDPASYKAFLETGTWPDKTMLVLEVRGARDKGSINQKGNYQGDLMGIEVHVRDDARFAGKWAFFGFDEGKTSKMIPTSASCYSCHSAHGAVDTTFVQFYPTLLPIATQKSTLSDAYRKETASASPAQAAPARK
jgi:hypothetical protein